MRERTLLGSIGTGVAAVCLCACGEGAPAPRGFGSHQVVQMRVASFGFAGYGAGYALYDTPNDDGTDTYWRLDAETGTVENLGPSPNVGVTPTPARFSCAENFTDTGFTFTITDTETGVETTIDRVVAYSDSACPTDADPSISLWRGDGAGHAVLWTGPYDDLQAVSLPVLVDRIVSVGREQTMVTGERPDAPGGIGIYDLDNATYAVTEIVPPTLAAATWAAGATPAGPLVSASVEDLPAGDLQIGQIGDHITYARRMSDGGTTVFLSPIVLSPSGELALFHADAGAMIARVAMLVGHAVPSYSLAWQYKSASVDVLLFWDAETERLISCPGLDVFRPVAYSNLGGRQFLFGAQSDSSGPASLGPVLLVSPDGDGRDGTCTQLASADAHDSQQSSDGALAWLVDAPGAQTALWTAAADGSAARMIGRGSIDIAPWAPYFYAPSRLELRLDRDLAWVDVRDDPVTMHYVAEQVFDLPVDYDNQVVIGYEFSDQDGTGSLGLVDRDTGDKRLISSQVVTYESIHPSSTDSPVRNYIVYLVRGRNPSSQDGLWVAAIAKDDVR